MSALAIDDLAGPVPTLPVRTRPAPVPRRWRHVERAPQARPHLVGLPGGRPAGVAAPALPARPAPGAAPRASARGWRLTDRGIAVVTLFFLALVATAAVVLVSAFLAVSDTPLRPVEAPVAVGVAA